MLTPVKKTHTHGADFSLSTSSKTLRLHTYLKHPGPEKDIFEAERYEAEFIRAWS